MSSTQQLLLAEGAGGAAPNYIEDVFSTYLYTANSSTSPGLTVTNGIDLSTKGGMVWIKSMQSSANNMLYDTVRGAGTGATSGTNKALSSNSTAAQGLGVTSDYLSAFNTDGFVVNRGGLNEANRSTNYTTLPYASWTFRKQPKFFDVVTFTGDGIAGRTVAHSLGTTPGCIIVKRTDSTGGWAVYHRGLNGGTTPQNYTITLNSTAAQAASSTTWNNTAPTSANFTLGVDAYTNVNGATYVAYLFAHDAGGFGLTGTDNVISCGTYTGNSAGVTVNLGYEAQWVMVKRTDTTGNWGIYDVMRGMPVWSAGDQSLHLYPNTLDIEAPQLIFYPTATGFSIPDVSSDVNITGGTYVYVAIRRGLMKTPTDATKVFIPVVATPASPSVTVTTNFPVDLLIDKARAGSAEFVFDRMRCSSSGGTTYLKTNADQAQTADASNVKFNSSTSIVDHFLNGSLGITTSAIYYNFRRANGFFDIVCDTGTGSVHTVNHNLGVVPTLILRKRRSTPTENWIVSCAYDGFSGNADLRLNQTSAASSADSTLWNNTAPTASVFTLGTATSNNGSTYTYVSYLFATCAGVSKVGSYTGTGTTKQVDCGFAAGARFVMIKRVSTGGGDWYVWDSARGIVAGNDPYLLFNGSAADVTNTDYVDTYSAGFEISSTAPAAINGSGGTFIFLAIA